MLYWVANETHQQRQGCSRDWGRGGKPVRTRTKYPREQDFRANHYVRGVMLTVEGEGLKDHLRFWKGLGGRVFQM